jgi:hypothetical protein
MAATASVSLRSSRLITVDLVHDGDERLVHDPQVVVRRCLRLPVGRGALPCGEQRQFADDVREDLRDALVEDEVTVEVEFDEPLVGCLDGVEESSGAGGGQRGVAAGGQHGDGAVDPAVGHAREVGGEQVGEEAERVVVQGEGVGAEAVEGGVVATVPS